MKKRWVLNVTTDEFNKVARIADECSKYGDFDESRWETQLKELGLWPNFDFVPKLDVKIVSHKIKEVPAEKRWEFKE